MKSKSKWCLLTDFKNHTCRYNPVAFEPLQPHMDSCEIYKSGVESERLVLTTRNPAEVVSILKRFIGAWRLSDPAGVTIFGWHLAKKLNLAVPPLTGIPFCSGWYIRTSMFSCELHTHALLEKPYQGSFPPKGASPDHHHFPFSYVLWVSLLHWRHMSGPCWETTYERCSAWQ